MKDEKDRQRKSEDRKFLLILAVVVLLVIGICVIVPITQGVHPVRFLVGVVDAFNQVFRSLFGG